jgi:hypothetical protein
MAESIEQLKAQLAEEATARKAAESALEQSKKTGIISPPVQGTFTVVGENADGKETKRKFRFKNGRTRTPLRNGQLVPSAALIALANGTAIDKIEGVATFPWFAELTKETAQAELERLVMINSSTVDPA